MEIPKNLPQFTHAPAFMCVLGAKYGLIYYLSNGVLLMLDELEQELPFQDNNEGFFLRSAYGERLGIWEDTKELFNEIEKRFIKQIHDELKLYIKHLAPETVYLFAPEYMHKKLFIQLERIPNVHFEIMKKGNYTKASPLELLASTDTLTTTKPDSTEPSSVDSMKKNADEKRKILLKFKQAQGQT